MDQRRLNPRGLLPAAILIPILALSGCSGMTDGGGDVDSRPGTVFYGKNHAEEEFTRTLAGFELPEGVVAPEDPLSGWAEDGSFQQGLGSNLAASFWNCSWGRTYLAAVGTDEVNAGVALDQFASLLDTPVYRDGFDHESADELFNRIIDSARLGDPAPLESFIGSSCRNEGG